MSENNNDFKYNAFISYRHSELDKYVAENLHRLIETYKMPKQVVEKYNITDNNIRRVFRDKDELPLSSNLQDPIYEALKQSKFLIVICSPRLRDSEWCKREIKTFIEMHGRKNILCVLIEGEPDESFPEELLYYEEIKNGKKVKTLCEPLAMDVRGSCKKEIYKNMNEELIRLIAPMYNLDYDDIKRRHEERILKNKVRIFRIISLVSIVFALYSSILFFKIYVSSKQLKYDQAINLAVLSRERMLKDDRMGALENAYQSLTKYNNITSDGIYALAESLGVYYTPNNFYPLYQLDTKGVIEGIKVNSDGKFLLSYDNSGELVLWNLENHSRVKTITDVDSSIDKNKFLFISNDMFVYQNSDKKIIIENLEGNIVDSIDLDFKINNISVCDKYLEVNTSNKVYVYEIGTYKEVVKFNISSYINDVYFDDSFENIIIVSTDGSTGKNEVITYNISKNTTLKTKFDTEKFVKVLLCDDNLIILSLKRVSFNTSMNIINYNYKIGIVNFEKEYGKEYPIDICLKDNKSILAAAYDTTYLLDFNTGGEKAKFSIGDRVINIYSINNSNIYRVFTKNGDVHNIDSSINGMNDEDNDIIITGLFNFNLQNYEEFLYTSNSILAYTSNDNRIIVYGQLKNDNISEISYEDKTKKDPVDKKTVIEEYNFEKKDFINQLMYSDNEEFLFVSYKNGSLEVYNNKTKKLINTIDNIKLVTEYVGKINDKYIIKGQGCGYILNKDFELVFYVPNLYDCVDDKLIIKIYEKYYEVKLYSEKELIKMAKERFEER